MASEQQQQQDNSAPNNPTIEQTEQGPALVSQAFKDAEQAAAMCTSLEESNKERAEKEALIREKYDGGPPYVAAELRSDQQDWRSNFSTHFMSGIVDRVVPSLVRSIESARYLSNATFRSSASETQTRKATRFRELITQVIRRWDGWRPLLEALAQENGLMGYTSAAILDPFDWHPQQFATNEAFFPEGTGLQARLLQSGCFRQDMMPHELITMLAKVGLQNAVDRGWNLENCEEALMQARSEAGTTDNNDPRKMQDLVREGTSASSCLAGVKVIPLWHALAVEADGRVTRYIIHRTTKKPLYAHLVEYPGFAELCVLFTYEQGPSKKYYGSKGMGRRLYNPHVALDRGRNTAFDALYLSGLLIVKATQSARTRMSIQVKHPFVVLEEGAEISEQRFEFNVEAYFALDQKISSLAEISTGAFIPSQLTNTGDSAKTATETTIDASREEQVKINVLERWTSHIANLISLMTHRICDPSTADEEARRFQQQLIAEEGFLPEEIAELAATPATQTVADISTQQQAGIVALADKYRGDPAVDQMELKRREISAMTSPQVADALLIAEPDVTVAAEQTRTQLMEFGIMFGGDQAPVSPRDNHLIHATVCADKLGPMLQGMDAAQPIPPEILGPLGSAVEHMGQHLQAMVEAGAGEEARPFMKVFELAKTAVAKAIQDAQMQQPAPGPEPAPPDAPVPMEGAPLPPEAQLPLPEGGAL